MSENIKKIRVVNDGTHAYTTKITDADTGKELERATSVEIYIEVEHIPVATISTVSAVNYTSYPHVDIVADVKKMISRCPCCGHETSIKNEDREHETPLQG